jgi:hypothetical protein
MMQIPHESVKVLDVAASLPSDKGKLRKRDKESITRVIQTSSWVQ